MATLGALGVVYGDIGGLGEMTHLEGLDAHAQHKAKNVRGRTRKTGAKLLAVVVLKCQTALSIPQSMPSIPIQSSDARHRRRVKGRLGVYEAPHVVLEAGGAGQGPRRVGPRRNNLGRRL